MNTSHDPAAFPYRELARRLGREVPPGSWTEAAGPLDLTGCWLFAPCHPWIVQRLHALPGNEETVATAVREALTELFGGALRPHLWAGGEDAVAGALDAARRATGREEVARGGADASPGDSLAAMVFSLEDDVTAEDAAGQAREARRAGARIVVDERRTAGRWAGGASPLVRLLDPDLVIVGENLAGGMPFGAVLARDANADENAPPDAVSLAFAAATLGALRDEPVAARIAAAGETIRARFAERCRREDVRAALVGPAGAMRLVFAGQENAEAERMLEHFGRELEARGVRAGRVVYPLVPAAENDDVAPAAFEEAVGRIRTLLVEFNSYLSGGLPFPFPCNEPRLVKRGLTRYRFPARADTSITVAGESVRVSFAPEACALTSSGFYVPTRVRGDFTVTVDYEIRRWKPGADCANFALFVQNELSSARYYAQRRSSADDPARHESFCVSCGEESPPRVTTASRGSFRLRRTGRTLSAFHREEGGHWVLLGTDEHATDDDVFAGAKIWSLVRNDGLEVDFSALRIEGELPADQAPVLPPRPDPRSKAGGSGGEG